MTEILSSMKPEQVEAFIDPNPRKDLFQMTLTAEEKRAMQKKRAGARTAAPSTPKRVPSPISTETEPDWPQAGPSEVDEEDDGGRVYGSTGGAGHGHGGPGL